jgi:hypothetical protein
MIAYHFPPEGNAGAYRPLRFVRHLPFFAWHPTVVTLETENYERYDPALLEQVPDGVEVIRVPNRDPWQALMARRAKRVQDKLTAGSCEQKAQILSAHERPMRSRAREFVRSLEARLYHPDIAMGWIAAAAKAVEHACEKQSAHVIWATAGPVSAFHVAERASRRTGIPHVLDFRDAWTITYNEFEERRPRWATLRDWSNMFRLLKGSQAAIFRSHAEAECYHRAYRGALDAAKIHILPNGFEGGVESSDVEKGNKCEFLYAGTLGDYRYDTLLQAIRLLKTSFPAEAAQMHFHFVGEGSEVIAKHAKALNLSDILSAEGAISQGAVAELSKKAHALLLLGRPAEMKGHELFAAAKLFGYLKAGKPIVGILPDDQAMRILQRVGVSTVANVESQDEIVAVLRRVLHNWRDGTLESLAPDATACQAYSAASQTQALVAALEGAPAFDPFVPGTVDIPDSLREEINCREHMYNQKPLRVMQNTPIAPSSLRNHP